MPSLEESFDTACKDGAIPGAILLAADKTGSFTYSRVFGKKSLDSGKPLEMNTILWTASCTKLMTSIAAMQCVERGLITLDDDVAEILPELAKLEILTGFDDSGAPMFKKRQNALVLRQLLTHSVGMRYDFTSPMLQAYRKHRNEPMNSGPTIIERYSAPLLYEPGTSWSYGPAIDWAGLYLERKTGQKLEAYMQQNIWAPLEINDITFWPDTHPDMTTRKADLSTRDPKGSGKVIHLGPSPSTAKTADAMGGQGAYASMPDYFKILHSILIDDEKLLKKKTAAQMFLPQLTKQSQEAQSTLMKDPASTTLFVGEFPTHVGLDWGIGGILTMEDIEGWRRKNTLIWSGLPNLFWFIDREAGICGLYGSQVTPPGDVKSGKMITMFEKAMYERSGALKAKI